MNETVFLCERYANFGYEHLTNQSIQKAKECLIDYLGCVYAGFPYESSKIVREHALEEYPRGNCTLIGCKEKLNTTGACFVNATTGHGPELDDISKEAGLHVGVVIIPVALAMSESMGVGGRDFLLSIVMGYDVDIKIGRAANPRVQLGRGFHPTASCGTFGAAMTAARILDLDAERMANVMGIAGSYASGSLECYSDGSLTKRLQPGIAASSGVTAALLAARGYTGPKSILEGPRGFFHAFSQDCNPKELASADGLEIGKVSFKAHACCGFNQTPIDAMLEIRSKYGVDHRDIASILIELTQTAYDIVGQPAEIKFHPKSIADAQFSAPYSVAVACIEGRAGLKECSEEVVKRPNIHEFMKKITVTHSPELDRFVPQAIPARVGVTANNSKRYLETVKYAKGDPENPLSWEEVLGKFNNLVPSNLLTRSQRGKIIEAVENLEGVKNIKEFTGLLS